MFRIYRDTPGDIAIRSVAAGKFDATARDVCSEQVCYRYKEDDTERAAGVMGDNRVRRLPVLDSEKRLMSIVSIGDISRRNGNSAGIALSDISEANEAAREPGLAPARGAGQCPKGIKVVSTAVLRSAGRERLECMVSSKQELTEWELPGGRRGKRSGRPI